MQKGLNVPKLAWDQIIAAGATFLPLTGWQFEYAPFGGIITLLHRADAIALVVTVTTGSDTLQERSPVSAGGTPGVVPSELDTPALTEEVAGGDRIKILYDNTGGVAVNVTGEIDYTPA